MPEVKAGKVAVYAVDEVHLLEGDLISHLWGDKRERLHIPIMNERNRQTYYGALNLMTQELIIGEYSVFIWDVKLRRSVFPLWQEL
jgi:putative transposase